MTKTILHHHFREMNFPSFEDIASMRYASLYSLLRIYQYISRAFVLEYLFQVSGFHSAPTIR